MLTIIKHLLENRSNHAFHDLTLISMVDEQCGGVSKMGEGIVRSQGRGDETANTTSLQPKCSQPRDERRDHGHHACCLRPQRMSGDRSDQRARACLIPVPADLAARDGLNASDPN